MENLDELYELKKALIQYEFDNKNYAGAYFPGVHTLDINTDNVTYPQAIITYIHESMHYVVHNKSLGVFQMDYFVLYYTLVYFSSMYKGKKINDYLNDKDIFDEDLRKKYIFVNSSEIDHLLAKDQKYVAFLKFCISIFDIYYYSIINSKIINEGVATYVSLNIGADYYLYNAMNLNDFFL